MWTACGAFLWAEFYVLSEAASAFHSSLCPTQLRDFNMFFVLILDNFTITEFWLGLQSHVLYLDLKFF